MNNLKLNISPIVTHNIALGNTSILSSIATALFLMLLLLLCSRFCITASSRQHKCGARAKTYLFINVRKKRECFKAYLYMHKPKKVVVH